MLVFYDTQINTFKTIQIEKTLMIPKG